MRKILLAVVFIGVFCGCSVYRPVETPVLTVVDVYHGTEVEDPYRWLEDYEDVDVKVWNNEQNAMSRVYLDKLPYVDEIRERITGIESSRSVRYYGLAWEAGVLFAVKREPMAEQPVLVAMPSADEPEKERVVLDLNELDASGATSMDFYVPSPDGKLAAVSLSVSGTESGDVHVFEVASGDQVDVAIPRVNGGTAGGSVSWAADSSGLYYTRYPRGDERKGEDVKFYQQVYYHELGTNTEADRYEIGKEFPRIAEVSLETDHESGRVLATVQYGDSGRFSHYVREVGGQWRQITGFDSQIVQATFGPGDSLYLISRKNAGRGKVLRLSLTGPDLRRAKVIVRETSNTIVSFFDRHPMVATAERLYVTYQLGGPMEIGVFDHDGTRLKGPATLPVSRVGQIVAVDDDDILYSNSSYVEPAGWYRYSAADGATAKTALAVKAGVDFSDCAVSRIYATSKDGTKVPVNVIRLKSVKLDGKNPTLLTGYGGYNISQTPGFLGVNRVWIEQGGVYAIANIRGGGEFGDKWHRDGALTKKQNVFDDFAAAMEYLIDVGFTNRDKLAIKGGSNGGLLMGAMVVQHPELARVAVSSVGIYDMLRVELSPNGKFNIPEFGTVADVDQFRALHAYSPYHNVVDGVKYPAVLFMTGANDPRVDPMQSRKMTARLQAATGSRSPILLRSNAKAGHGVGAPLSERIEQRVDGFAFLFNELGVKYKRVDQ